MKISPAEARNIVTDDHDDWAEVCQEIDDTSRWSIHYSGVFEHLPTGKFYKFYWSVGATETQDEGPYEYATEDIEPIEVKQVEKTIIAWERV